MPRGTSGNLEGGRGGGAAVVGSDRAPEITLPHYRVNIELVSKHLHTATQPHFY